MARMMMKVKKFVTNGTDEVEEIEVMELVEFEPPICNECNQYMRNINTVNGVRKFGCVTWGCTNKKMVTYE